MTEVFALRGRVVTSRKIITDGAVVVSGDAIVWVGEAPDAKAAGFGDEVLAATSPSDDRYLLPGLIDVHCHGGQGVSFPDAQTEEQALRAISEHLRWGTTSLVASLVTHSPMVLREKAEMLAGMCAAGKLAGIHFEGPFIAQGNCGAHDPSHIQAPNAPLVRELLIASRGYAVSMTFAPEKPYAMGASGVADTLIAGGAVPSFGHTDTNSEKMREALIEIRQMLAHSARARCPHATVTHLFNSMPPIQPLHPGPIPEILADAAGGGVIVELICDGKQLAPSLIRNVYELVGREQIVFVTDAMAGTGLGDGRYLLGGQTVEVKDGLATLAADSNCQAGGTSHLIQQVKIAHQAGIPLVDAVYCASYQGAKVLGDDQLGEIAPGKSADLLVTDADLNPMRVYKRGVVVF